MYFDRESGEYQVIGEALLQYEKTAPFIFSSIDAHAAYNFRISVSSVVTEILQGYLDDLVGPVRSDRDLHIPAEKFSFAKICGTLSFVGMVVSIGISFVTLTSTASTESFSSYIAAVILACISIPLLYITYQGWSRQARRIRFARVVSFELARRRGESEEGEGKVSITDFIIRGLSPQSVQPPKVFSKIKIH